MDELICKICNSPDCKCAVSPQTYDEAGWEREPSEPSHD